MDTEKDTVSLMSATYLVQRQAGHSFLFRSFIPTDLQSRLASKQFQLSLRCGIHSQAKSLSLQLNLITKQIYNQLRLNAENIQLSISDIKELLRSELDKLRSLHAKEIVTPELSTVVTKTELASPQEADSISLVELSTNYLESKQGAGFPTKTINGYKDTHKLLLEILGNQPISQITHADARKVIDVIRQLPSNRSKSYPTLSIQELLQLKNVKLLSHKTILKHIERVSALFNWAITQGYTQQNVFKGKVESIRKTEVIEKHFTESEMKLILGEKLKKESLEQNKPERYWVTLLSAYSGARLNEICQLDITDIEKQGSIWVMKLQADGKDKSIKTQAGNRIIPLHPKLLELGFIDYVIHIRQSKKSKLFPQLKWRSSTGFGTKISRWFARYLKRLGIKQRGKNFHSFRHTVVNKLTTAQVYQPFIKELIGHSQGSITMDVYGGRKPVSVLLNECVIKI